LNLALPGTEASGWFIYQAAQEWKRCGFKFGNSATEPWRISEVNQAWECCKQYPQTLVLPNSGTVHLQACSLLLSVCSFACWLVSDGHLSEAAKIRELKQFPVAIWMSARTLATLSRAMVPQITATTNIESLGFDDSIVLRVRLIPFLLFHVQFGLNLSCGL